MKWYKGPEGDQRIWFEPEEIEQIAEDELRKAGLFPTPTAPVTDLERFLEGHLKASLDQYAELEPEVLGLTRFESGRPPAVSINQDLTGAVDEESQPGLTGRWRATIAHEGAHVLLHRVLFELDEDQGTLFPSTPSGSQAQRLMRCLKRDVGPQSRSTDWREIQANKGMAALLMPRRVFVKVARLETAALGLSSLTAGSPSSVALARRLATIFTVSRQAASIRLETLAIVGRRDEPTLPTVN